MPSGTYGNYSQRAIMIIISGISGTTQSEIITSPPNNDKYSITNMNRSTRQVSRVYQLSNYEGHEVDHGDDDGDGVGLDGVDEELDGDSGGGMEEPSGGGSGSVSPLRSPPAAAF